MGVLKIDHIRKILFAPNVSARWREVVKRDPTETDVENLFANFVPLQLECLVKYSTVIDGVAETVARLRKRGIKIGSTTGYTRAMLGMIIVPAAPTRATVQTAWLLLIRSVPDARIRG